jgi:GNAT superfamily N-acetyltransferase
MDLASATEAFARGYASARSLSYPYLPEHSHGLWLLRDRPARRRGRAAELVGAQPQPQAIWQAAAGIDESWAVSVVECEDPDQPRTKPAAPAQYAASGLRRRGIEPLFVARPGDARALLAGDPPAGVRLVRVRTAEMAERLRIANRGRRQVEPADLTSDRPLRRLFAALAGDEPLGWVTAIQARPDAAFVSNLFVLPAARRRGVGTALMQALLGDDAERCVRHSVLTASNAGALLYPRIGYRQIATVHLFGPARSH